MPNQNNNEKYQAKRKEPKTSNSKNDRSSSKDVNKKIGKMASKAAANYFTGGKGGKVVDKLANTKLGSAAMQKMGDSFVKKNPGIGKIAERLNNAGALDLADKFDSLGNKSNQDVNQSNSQIDSDSGSSKGINALSDIGKKNKFIQRLKDGFSGDSSQKGDEKEESNNESVSDAPFSANSFLKGIIAKNPVVSITAIIMASIFLITFFAFMTCIMSSASDGSGKSGEEENTVEKSSDSTTCSMISIHNTSLTKSQFAEKLKAKANSSGIIGYKTFAANADTIYDISVKNNINPEMVVIRAAVEGFSPGASKNNYWGMGCTNSGGYNACISYSSFSAGVLGYIKNISQYDSVESMMSRYAYIGAYWYSPGSSSRGGCYYYPYVKKYMSASRAETVKNACSKSCSESSCMKTNAEDSKAYTLYQVETMTNQRSNIFGIGADKCESSDKDTSGGEIGKKAAEYAVKTFDSFSYSQTNRMGPSSVDCSSLVTRTYSHFNINISGVAADEYKWCESKGKAIKEKDLAPGDLIFFSQGSHSHPGRYKNIGHVAIYIGNNKQFAAHSSRYPQPDQVSVKSYTRGVGSYFCRPYK